MNKEFDNTKIVNNGVETIIAEIEHSISSKNKLETKYKLIKDFENEVFLILENIKHIYNVSTEFTKIEHSIKFIKKLVNLSKVNKVNKVNTLENIVETELIRIEYNSMLISLLIIIKEEFIHILDNDMYKLKYEISDAKYAKNQLVKTVIFANKIIKECTDMDIVSSNISMDLIYNQLTKNTENSTGIEIIKEFELISKIYQKYKYTWNTYCILTDRILIEYKYSAKICSSILDVNEKNKDYILSIPNVVKSKVNNFIDTDLNPYLKSYGLIPVSNLLQIQDIAQLIFPNHKDKVETLEKFVNLCKVKYLDKTNTLCDYDLIIIKKYLNNGIDYNILDLMDFGKSMKYSQINNDRDGITLETVNRFSNIKYINKSKKLDFKIKYDFKYKSKNSSFVIILEETYNKYYHVLSNSYNKDLLSYFVRKYNVPEFMKFVEFNSEKQITRIDNYNKITNKKILTNMFLGIKRETRDIKEKSKIIDPKYLRYEIKYEIEKNYKLITKPIKNIYDFSIILHDEIYLNIFSDIIIREYSTEVDKNLKLYNKNFINIAELYSSFIRYLNEYEKEFKKNIHDEFTKIISEILKSDIFIKSETEIKKYFFQVFSTILQTTLNKIITSEKNIFQILEYKTRLFNLLYD